MRYWILTACMWLSSCHSLTQLPDGIQPVTTLSLERYLGQWYEIARLDHSFERGLSHVTAHYELNQDGTLKVTNRGYDHAKQSWKTANGKAKLVGDASLGHLKVSFFGPFYASYVIFELDPQYQYALVTSHDRSYVWLLSRTPTLPSEITQRLTRTLTDHGFDTNALIWVNQLTPHRNTP